MGALPTTDLEGYEQLRKRVDSALGLLKEGKSVDFKRAAMWDEVKKGIPKDILAMSNSRDGGIIIIGVEESDNRWNQTGMTDEQLRSYNPDDMLDQVNKYASPSINFDVAQHTDDERLKYLVIQIRQFEEMPIVCKRDAEELRKGALYIRPIGKAESREVQTADEMHDLLELAVEKRTRHFLSQIQRVGIDLGNVPLVKSDMDKFDDELEGL